jgi:uncharacterized protein YjbJ (UPF0337 family)
VVDATVGERPGIISVRLDADPGGVMNQDELKGKIDQVKGRAKQAAGDITDNERLHDEGVADEMGGKVQDTFGKARRKVGDVIEDLGKDVKR